MNGIDVNALVACDCRRWYYLFEKFAIKSLFIPIDERFVDYLKSDGVVLPKSSLVHSFRNDELSDDDDVVSVEGESAVVDDFSDLTVSLRNVIRNFDGKVFIKLNWSAPSDASWMNAGSLSCMTNGDVFLLLKSSTKITNDIELLEMCRKNNIAIDGCITVKKWANLHLSMEFRVFVVNGRIRGISQRDVATYYSFLQDDEYLDHLQNIILSFVTEKILPDFALPSYAVDLYIDKKERIWILDFNVFGPITNPLLYSYDELLSEQLQLELRVVESDLGTLSHPSGSTRGPIDMIENREQLFSFDALKQLCTNKMNESASESDDER